MRLRLTHYAYPTAEWYLPVRRGLHPAPATPSLLQKHFSRVSTDPEAWEPLLTPSRVGESMRAIHLRCARFAPLLAQSLAERGYSRAIVFTHAATAIALCRALAGDVRLGDDVLSEGATEPGQAEQLGLWNDEERLPVAAATCSVSKFASRGPEWERLWDGRTDFLERGEEVSPFIRPVSAGPMNELTDFSVSNSDDGTFPSSVSSPLSQMLSASRRSPFRFYLSHRKS